MTQKDYVGYISDTEFFLIYEINPSPLETALTTIPSEVPKFVQILFEFCLCCWVSEWNLYCILRDI